MVCHFNLCLLAHRLLTQRLKTEVSDERIVADLIESETFSVEVVVDYQRTTSVILFANP